MKKLKRRINKTIMPNFRVTISTTIEYVYKIEASNYMEAEEKAEHDFKYDHPSLYPEDVSSEEV